MIDFRYHLVSLISVFLALAVGIILGAGPLKEAIGDQLSGQVTELRAEKEQLRSDLTAETDLAQGSEQLLTQLAPSALAGRLPARHVAIVQIGTVDADLVQEISVNLGAAGATVVSRINLDDTWFTPEAADTRQSYASSLAEYLNPTLATGSYDETLAHAFALAFSGYAAPIGDDFSASAELTREILTSSGLLSVTTGPSAPADAYVIVEQPVTDGTMETTFFGDQGSPTIGVQLAAVLARDSEGVVVVTGAETAGTLVEAVQADPDVTGDVSTVVGIESVGGQILTPMALSSQIAGAPGDFSALNGAAVLPEAVALGVPDRGRALALGAPDSADNPDIDGSSGTEGNDSERASSDADGDGTDADGTDTDADADADGAATQDDTGDDTTAAGAASSHSRPWTGILIS